MPAPIFDQQPLHLLLCAVLNMTEEIEHTQGFTLGIRVTFEDQLACRDYIQHPLHQQLLQSIGPFVEGIVVMDYPFAKRPFERLRKGDSRNG
jgi:hypothetical protein